ncbi:MAG: cell division topological specificity factor MinE [Anaerolineae bacterium]|nr:MAG: cell division topological specificity factor MinE [Anaerolineae bacterium]
MPDWLDRLLGRQPNSATQARERLQLVLVHDRTNLSPAKLDELKDEIIEVISRHIEIDPQAVQIEVSQDGREQRLIADIPLRPRRSR